MYGAQLMTYVPVTTKVPKECSRLAIRLLLLVGSTSHEVLQCQAWCSITQLAKMAATIIREFAGIQVNEHF